MKALEILNLYHTHGEDIMFVSFKKYYVEEAIAELEALGNRSCEGCNYMKKDECDIRYCWCPASPLSNSNQALHPSFYCSEWKAKQ